MAQKKMAGSSSENKAEPSKPKAPASRTQRVARGAGAEAGGNIAPELADINTLVRPREQRRTPTV